MSIQEAESSILSSPVPAEHFLELAEVWNPSYFAQKKDALHSLLERLETLPPTEHLPTEVVTFACGLSIGWQLPFALIEHEENYLTEGKTNILLRERDTISAQLGTDKMSVSPLKTVTLRVRYKGIPRYFLLTRIGDLPLDGLLYYQDKIEGFVALAVSLRETLIIKGSIFMFTLNWWQESRLVPAIPFRRVVKS